MISSTLGRSVQDRPIRYAIVGRRRNVTADGLATIRQSAARLQNPHTPAREVSRIVKRSPATLWIAGNVHGGEESGLDASLRTLYELADRRDCAATRHPRRLGIVVIVPSRTPTAASPTRGRTPTASTSTATGSPAPSPRPTRSSSSCAATRRSCSSTITRWAPRTFFFPPNADPIYHEITDQSVDWINNIYGARDHRPSSAAQGIDYFNYDIYDLFYMGYGDTVPTTGFGAAGMTFEKNNAEPMPVRAYEQYVSQWTSLSAAGGREAGDPRPTGACSGWTALRQGEDGYLEPNEVVQRTNTVQFEVPDITVRNYFIRDDDPDKKREVQALVRRLQRMDVLRAQAPRAARGARLQGLRAVLRPRRRCRAPTGSRWPSARSTGFRRCSTRAPTCRSRTSTT